MSGYQDFARLFGSGVFVRSDDIRGRYPFQKALASLYVIPAFFKGAYYIPTDMERKGHYIKNAQDFFTGIFDFRYGRKKWYWGLSTAARHYGVEWSATRILEIVTPGRPKVIDISKKVISLRNKRSYRSLVLAKILGSLETNLVYVHKGDSRSLSSLKIDDAMGPVCSKEQLIKDIERFLPKAKDHRIKSIYRRIRANLAK